MLQGQLHDRWDADAAGRRGRGGSGKSPRGLRHREVARYQLAAILAGASDRCSCTRFCASAAFSCAERDQVFTESLRSIASTRWKRTSQGAHRAVALIPDIPTLVHNWSSACQLHSRSPRFRTARAIGRAAVRRATR